MQNIRSEAPVRKLLVAVTERFACTAKAPVFVAALACELCRTL